MPCAIGLPACRRLNCRPPLSTHLPLPQIRLTWLPAKSKIESHFLIFYARVPDGFRKIDDVVLDHGQIAIEDRTNGKQVTLKASKDL